MEIKPLPKDVIFSIRSGYKINTFSQCIVELILNSIDAKSTSIAIRLDIQKLNIDVLDNGTGISVLDLPAIGTRFMTSKFTSSNVFHKKPKYYGFRGEALASIQNLSKEVIITSRHKSCAETYTKVYREASPLPVQLTEPRSSPGTTIHVKNLFYGQSVRETSSKNYCSINDAKTAIQQISILHPEISFSLRDEQSDKVVLQIKKNKCVLDRAQQVFTHIDCSKLEYFNFKHELCLISGLVSRELISFADVRLFHVNKRISEDNCSMKIFFENQFSKLIPPKKRAQEDENECFLRGNFVPPLNKAKQYPAYVLNVKCPLNAVSMIQENFKVSVEFRDQKSMMEAFRGLLNTLKCKTLKTDAIKSQESLQPLKRLSFHVSQIDGVVKGPLVKRHCKQSEINREILLVSQTTNTKSEKNVTKSEVEVLKRKTVDDLSQHLKKILYSSDNAKEQTLFNVLKSTSYSTKSISKFLEKSKSSNMFTFQHSSVSEKYQFAKCIQNNENLKCRENTDFAGNDNAGKDIEKRINDSPIAISSTNFDCFTDGKELLLFYFLKSVMVYNQAENSCDTVENPESQIASEFKIPQTKLGMKSRNFGGQRKINIKSISATQTRTYLSAVTSEYNIYEEKSAEISYNEKSLNFNSNSAKCQKIAQSATTERKTTKKELTDFSDCKLKYQEKQHIMASEQHEISKTKYYTKRSTNTKVKHTYINPGNRLSFKNTVSSHEHYKYSCNETFVSHQYRKIKILDNKIIKNASRAKKEDKSCFEKNFVSIGIQTEENIEKNNSLPKPCNLDQNQAIVEQEESCIKDNFILFSSESEPLAPISILNQIETDRLCEKVQESTENCHEIISSEQILAATSETPDDLILPPQESSEWLSFKDCDGIPFYINTRTGMTLFQRPKESELFEIQKRKSFIPKGASPKGGAQKEIEKQISQSTKNNLFELLSEDCCTYDLLRKVKWLKYFKTKERNDQFFDSLYSNYPQLPSDIPNVYLTSKRELLESEKYKFSKNMLENVEVLRQIDDKFIAACMNFENKKLLTIFDQHAVDERIKLEELLKVYKTEDGFFKSMECDEVITMPFLDYGLKLLNLKEKFKRFGASFQIYDKNVVFDSVPLCLWKKANKFPDKKRDLLKNLLTKFILDEYELLKKSQVSSTMPPVFAEVINSEACRNAMKFGDKLSDEQCSKLISKLAKCNMPFQCAHGRPTVIPLMKLNSHISSKKLKPNLSSLRAKSV